MVLILIVFPKETWAENYLYGIFLIGAGMYAYNCVYIYMYNIEFLGTNITPWLVRFSKDDVSLLGWDMSSFPGGINIFNYNQGDP